MNKSKINNARLHSIIKRSIRKTLNEGYVPRNNNDYRDGYEWDDNPDNGCIYDATMGDDIKSQQEADMYANYGNKSQYPMDHWFNYDYDGELSMDAQDEPYDPDYLDEFDPEMTATRGNDPEFWKSKPKGFSDTIKESLRKGVKSGNKHKVKLMESQLQRVIKESVKRVLKEGIDDNLFGRIENAKEVLGADGFIMAMVKCLSKEQVERMMDFIERVYEVPSRDDDEDEEGEYIS